MPKKKLCVDFDDTIVESIFLKRVNRFLKTNYTADDFKNYYIDDIIPIDKRQEFFDTFCDTNPYLEVEFLPNVREVLERLSKTYDIYICSGCVMNNMPSASAEIFKYKYDFLIKNFPFLSPRKFIFTNSKEALCGDIIIDDYLDNLSGDFKEKYLFTSYHNKDFTLEKLSALGVRRVNSWKEIEKILLKNK